MNSDMRSVPDPKTK